GALGGDDGAAADEDEAADDDAAAGDDGVTDAGVAACGGGAAVHCTSTRTAASISARRAPRRWKDLNWDESSPLASVRHDRCVRGFASQVRRQRYCNFAAPGVMARAAHPAAAADKMCQAPWYCHRLSGRHSGDPVRPAA